jgi:hypothetical protein
VRFVDDAQTFRRESFRQLLDDDIFRLHCCRLAGTPPGGQCAVETGCGDKRFAGKVKA